MPKLKVSFTIDDEALALLKEAAEAQGESASAVAELAIRHYCLDYARHRIEVTITDCGAVGIAVERQGRAFYTCRPVKRGMAALVEAVVTIDRIGPLNRDAVVRALRAHRAWRAGEVSSGVPIEYSSDGYSVRVDSFPMRVDGRPDLILRFLRQAEQTIIDAAALSLRDVVSRRCSDCRGSVIEVRQWSPPGSETRTEWVCHNGHHVAVP